jgi:hypothetical protein
LAASVSAATASKVAIVFMVSSAGNWVDAAQRDKRAPAIRFHREVRW